MFTYERIINFWRMAIKHDIPSWDPKAQAVIRETAATVNSGTLSPKQADKASSLGAVEGLSERRLKTSP